MTTTPLAESVWVFHRTGQRCPGRRIGEVVAYDARLLPEYQVAGRPTIDRSFLLLDQGIQLTRPAVFDGPVEGWWYVDLVEIEPTEAGLVVHDLYVDFLVPPGADRYHVLDLDELADALHQGRITAAQCATVLRRTQRFIDRHLRADEEGSVDPPHQFPPACIAVLESLPCFFEQSRAARAGDMT
ncbi:DUF402 domain-containing protein [Nonomuraea sediminis]|uniref:DUF402 domain-containing protein n=1 Tax=Nonomuraea sediminis TaxID=2835864 RepID=UPI001BDC0EA2|nr:DUF402 domain-containing protein [Nonomuraea sediminis]